MQRLETTVKLHGSLFYEDELGNPVYVQHTSVIHVDVTHEGAVKSIELPIV